MCCYPCRENIWVESTGGLLKAKTKIITVEKKKRTRKLHVITLGLVASWLVQCTAKQEVACSNPSTPSFQDLRLVTGGALPFGGTRRAGPYVREPWPVLFFSIFFGFLFPFLTYFFRGTWIKKTVPTDSHSIIIFMG